MNKISIKHGLISIATTVIIIMLLILSGPASAVIVSLTQPNDATKGSDVSFSITTEIQSADILPIKYTNIIITGPNGFSKTCKVNNDGTDDCTDVDVTISTDPTVTFGYGYTGYGYDFNLGYGYDLGLATGLSYFGTGTITYNVIWHTPGDLADGTYNAKAEVFAEGTSSHTFSSSTKSFSISTASGGGGSSSSGGTNTEFRSGDKVVEPVTTPTPTEPVTTPKVTPAVSSEGDETMPSTAPATTGVAGITGAIVGFANTDVGKGTGIMILIIILGLFGYYVYRKRNN